MWDIEDPIMVLPGVKIIKGVLFLYDVFQVAETCLNGAMCQIFLPTATEAHINSVPAHCCQASDHFLYKGR